MTTPRSPRAGGPPTDGPHPRDRPLRIGLTGPIGCGKSTVGRWLAARGVALVDADALAREVTAPGEPAFEAVVGRFGPRYLAADGSLDRRALGRLVFADPAALAALEAIVHPAVRPLVLARLADAEARGRPVAIEAIKLLEAGLAAECDEVWLVTCDGAAQRSRLLDRGMPAPDVDQRVAAQAGLVARSRPAATRILDTSGTPEATERLVGEALSAALAAHEARRAARERGG